MCWGAFPWVKPNEFGTCGCIWWEKDCMDCGLGIWGKGGGNCWLNIPGFCKGCCGWLWTIGICDGRLEYCGGAWGRVIGCWDDWGIDEGIWWIGYPFACAACGGFADIVGRSMVDPKLDGPDGNGVDCWATLCWLAGNGGGGKLTWSGTVALTDEGAVGAAVGWTVSEGCACRTGNVTVKLIFLVSKTDT
jgi:hypothetical protein